MTWAEVNRDSPCPICGKADWCGRSDDGALRCMRPTDPPPGWRIIKHCEDGGIVYRPADEGSSPAGSLDTGRDWALEAHRATKAIGQRRLRAAAYHLGVRADALERLGVGHVQGDELKALRVGWSGSRDLPRPTSGICFPEADAQQRIIGLTLRAPDDRKGSPKGSKRGLSVPADLASLPDPVLILEGPSDTAAALSMGLAAVGRPAARAGADHLAALLKGREVIVVGETDPKDNGDWPGRDGARRVAQQLAKRWQTPVPWALPPGEVKDLRDWLKGQDLDLDDADACRTAGRLLLDELRQASQIAAPRTRATAPPPRLGQTPYRFTARGVIWQRPTANGDVDTQLANFTATITESVVEDDGEEKHYRFQIEAKLNGRSTTFTVPSERFTPMTWPIEELGPSAIIYPGFGAKDHLRAAIQMHSGEPPRRVVFTHLGWRKVDGKWIYLHAGGATGADGPVPNMEVTVAAGELEHYQLPEPPQADELGRAIGAFLRLLELGPDKIMVPLMAAAIRAPLGKCELSIHLVGPTGVFKTELAALIQQCYGAGMDASHLPAAWSSTANALEGMAFLAKDAVFVVDDLAPGGSAAEVARIHREAGRLFRAQGNRSARRRMRPDTTLRPAKPPRGLLLSTGEEVPIGQSIRARINVIEVSANDIDAGKLSECQADAAAGSYASMTAGFVRWLAPQYEAVRPGLHDELVELRKQAIEQGQHRRTPNATASLALGWRYLLSFARDVGAITPEERAELWQRGWTALLELARDQTAHQRASDPVQRFHELLAAVVASGRAYISGVDGDEPLTPERWGWRRRKDEWQPQGERIGWIDGDDLYLEPAASYRAAQGMVAPGDEVIGISPQTLWRRMSDRGFLLTSDEGHHTIRKNLGTRRQRVLHVAALSISQTEDTGEPVRESGPLWTDQRTASKEPTAQAVHENGPLRPQEGRFGPNGPDGPVLTRERPGLDDAERLEARPRP